MTNPDILAIDREFWPRSIYPTGPSLVLYLRTPDALEYIRRAGECEVSACSLEGFRYSANAMTPLPDCILDQGPHNFPLIKSWQSYRAHANLAALQFIRDTDRSEIPNVWTIEWATEDDWRRLRKNIC